MVQATSRRPGSGLSIAQILGYSPYEPDVVNARYVSIKRLRAGRAANARPSIATVTETKIPTERERREHSQTVQAKDPAYRGPLSACPAVLVSCSCPRFVFAGWEYGLYVNGAAEIIHGNGEPARDNNPSNTPACCKHLVRVLTTIKKERR